MGKLNAKKLVNYNVHNDVMFRNIHDSVDSAAGNQCTMEIILCIDKHPI